MMILDKTKKASFHLQLHLKCLQNRTLSYKSMFSKQTYPKFKLKKKMMTLGKKKKKSLIASAKPVSCDVTRLVMLYDHWKYPFRH